jgi:superfamily II DNA helicase RecQ
VADLPAAPSELVARLKAWRLEQAREQGVPAFVILHDRTLTEIARQQPMDETQLSQIGGIGARKLERYGAGLLAVLRETGE